MITETLLLLSMAVITATLRYSGFGIAHILKRHPRAQAGLTSSGFCLITSYLAVQLWENPLFIFPVCLTLTLSYFTKGILIPLILGWSAFVVLSNFVV